MSTLRSHSRFTSRITSRVLSGGFGLAAAPLTLAALAVGYAAAVQETGLAAMAAVDVPADAIGKHEVDAVHSSVAFKIKHLDIAYQLGRFDKFSGKVVLGAKPEDSSVSIEIEAASVNTNSPQRDDHLRNADFLNAKQFPTATFKSTKVGAKDSDTFVVTGDLELHGVKKSVTFDMDFLGAKDAGAQFGYKAGFYGQLTINRRDFGIDYAPNEVLGDLVELTLAIETNKSK